MKVNIEHKTKQTGIFSKTNHSVVVVTVQFSAEELALIHQHKLKDMVLIERDPPSHFPNNIPESDRDIHYLRVRNILNKSDEYTVANPVKAKNYEADVVEALKSLKSYITGVSEAPKSSSFDL